MLELSVRLNIGKCLVAIVWVFIVSSVIARSLTPFSGVFQGIGIFLVVSHAIEIVVFRKRMRGPGDYLLTMLFGSLQLKAIRIAGQAKNASGGAASEV